MVAWAFEVV